MDRVDPPTRSRIMASVGQRDTGPEVLLRSALHRSGLRFRLHDRKLPGRPDLVFPKFRAVLFVHGCFWHRHGCAKSTVPKTRREYWTRKFETNQERDERSVQLLQELDWRALLVWECGLVGKHALATEEVVRSVRAWLDGADRFGEIPQRGAVKKV